VHTRRRCLNGPDVQVSHHCQERGQTALAVLRGRNTSDGSGGQHAAAERVVNIATNPNGAAGGVASTGRTLTPLSPLPHHKSSSEIVVGPARYPFLINVAVPREAYVPRGNIGQVRALPRSRPLARDVRPLRRSRQSAPHGRWASLVRSKCRSNQRHDRWRPP
jgi:hypothetical protein